jgi:ubiquinone biosynthesis protein UbiJ
MSAVRAPNLILATLGRLLEEALNRALALDPEMRTQLALLEGRRIGVELESANLALAIRIDDGRLRVGPHWEQAADLGLRATPGSLLAFALRRADDSPLPTGKVEISGDAELARRVEKLMREFRPEIEEAFAQAFGDVIGVPIARTLHAALRWSRDSAQAFVRDSADFLRDDSRDLIAPAEMDQFLDDVDALRDRAERLAARLGGLAVRATGNDA